VCIYLSRLYCVLLIVGVRTEFLIISLMTGTFVVDDVECMLCMHVSCHLSVTFRHIR